MRTHTTHYNDIGRQVVALSHYVKRQARTLQRVLPQCWPWMSLKRTGYRAYQLSHPCQKMAVRGLHHEFPAYLHWCDTSCELQMENWKIFKELRHIRVHLVVNCPNFLLLWQYLYQLIQIMVFSCDIICFSSLVCMEGSTPYVCSPRINEHQRARRTPFLFTWNGGESCCKRDLAYDLTQSCL